LAWAFRSQRGRAATLDMVIVRQWQGPTAPHWRDYTRQWSFSLKVFLDLGAEPRPRMLELVIVPKPSRLKDALPASGAPRNKTSVSRAKTLSLAASRRPPSRQILMSAPRTRIVEQPMPRKLPPTFAAPAPVLRPVAALGELGHVRVRISLQPSSIGFVPGIHHVPRNAPGVVWETGDISLRVERYEPKLSTRKFRPVPVSFA